MVENVPNKFILLRLRIIEYFTLQGIHPHESGLIEDIADAACIEFVAGEWRIKNEDNRHRPTYDELEKEVQQLRDWKESAMKVMPDYQKIGRLIGVKLGDNVHDKIIPYLEKTQTPCKHEWVSSVALKPGVWFCAKCGKYTLSPRPV